jgi:hypothetical protein
MIGNQITDNSNNRVIAISGSLVKSWVYQHETITETSVGVDSLISSNTFGIADTALGLDTIGLTNRFTITEDRNSTRLNSSHTT